MRLADHAVRAAAGAAAAFLTDKVLMLGNRKGMKLASVGSVRGDGRCRQEARCNKPRCIYTNKTPNLILYHA